MYIMRVALFFDIFAERGGAERVAIMLAKELNADVYTTYVDWNNVDKELRDLKIKEIGLLFKNLKLLTYTEIILRFLMLDISKKYDIFLFMRTYCFSASKKHHPNIWISTGIQRPVYDLHTYFYRRLDAWQRPLFKIWCKMYKFFDRMFVKNFDKILVNSKFTKERIKKYYNLDSEVVYHPVETSKFFCKSYENFYLTSSRLVKEKQLDLVIKAFKEMPNKNLIIAGDGPERKKLEKLARGCKNIKFLGAVDFDKMIDLYSRCTATLSMCVSEDLGLIPIESMASGKPCIASDAGGHKETIIHGKTGFLIKPTISEIKKYVNYLTPEKAEKMKNDCIERAKKFDMKVFIESIRNEAQRLCNEYKKYKKRKQEAFQ